MSAHGKLGSMSIPAAATARNILRTLIRFAALACIITGFIRFVAWLDPLITYVPTGEALTELLRSSSIFRLLLIVLPWPAAAALLLLFERHLIRWLIPPAGNRCPGCDYDLASATAARCPECGLPLPTLPPL
jgi:hypothetical protein